MLKGAVRSRSQLPLVLLVYFVTPTVDVEPKIERWRRDYNEFRPHSALTYLTPAEFAQKTGSEAV